MTGVSKQDRERAFRAAAIWCMAQAQDIELKQSIVEELEFGSIEAMRAQLSKWGVPDGITQGEQAVEKPKRPNPAISPRRATSSGPPTQTPELTLHAPLARTGAERVELSTA